MTDRDDLRQERDERLAKDFASEARHLRSEFREWLQDELKDLLLKAQILESTLQGFVRQSMQQAIQRMKAINRCELGEAIDNLDQKIREIEDGRYDDALDARRYLEEGISTLAGLYRELLQFRKLVDGLGGN